MVARNPDKTNSKVGERLSRGDFRLTKQRKEVYEAVSGRRDHPTATEIFIDVKDRMPTISLATIYNCLEALTQVGLVRQVNLHREPSRFCPNVKEHGHFFCGECGAVMDVDFRGNEEILSALRLPKGAVVKELEFSLSGSCPECSRKNRKS